MNEDVTVLALAMVICEDVDAEVEPLSDIVVVVASIDNGVMDEEVDLVVGLLIDDMSEVLGDLVT